MLFLIISSADKKPGYIWLQRFKQVYPQNHMYVNSLHTLQENGAWKMKFFVENDNLMSIYKNQINIFLRDMFLFD